MPDDIDLKFSTREATDALEPQLVSGGGTLIVVDTSVAGFEKLLDGLSPDAEVLLFDGANGGLADLATALGGRAGLSSIQIVSHGGEGALVFGTDTVTADNIEDHSDALATIGKALGEGGDLLLYGCEVGGGGTGQAFIDAVAKATGADVAASDDLTGSVAAGGDWDLEIRTGDIEAETPFSDAALADFSGVLAIPGTINFSSIGTAGSLGGANSVNASATDSGYTLTLDGASASTYMGFGRGYTSSGETMLTLSFNGGYQFSATSIYLYNVSGTNDSFKITSDQGDSVTTGTYADSAGGTINLTGFDNITKLYIYAVDNSGYFSIDNLAISSISAPNNAPTVSGAPSDVTVTEDTASNLDLSAVTFADADGDSLTVTLAVGAGTMAASSGGSVTVGGSGTGTMTLSGTAANINTFLDTASNIQYTGASNANGDDATTLTITPNDGTVDGTPANVNIDITAVNDAPTISGAPSDVTVTEDTASNLDLSAITLADVEGDSLTVTLAAGAGTMAASSGGGVTVGGSGTGTMTLSGTVANINTFLDTASNIQYTGASNANGNDATTVTITPNDGTVNGTPAVVNIDITAVNDAPTISGAPSDVTVTEDTASDLDLSAVTFADVEGDSLTVTLAAGAGTMAASSGGGVTIGGSGTGTMTLTGTVANINTYLDTASNIQYTGASNAAGNDATTLTITPNDGTDDGTPAVVNIDITGVNDDPSGAGAPSDITVAEDTASSVDFSGISFTDVDGDTVTVKVSAGAGTFGLANPAPYSLAASGNGTGTFTLTGTIADIESYFDTPSNVTYATASNVTGNDVTTIAVTINDGNGGGDIAVGTVNVDSAAVNDAPTFAGLDGTPSFTEGGSAVTLDSDVTVADLELDAAADFAGASLTIARNGGADTTDTFGFGASGSFAVSGGDLQAGGLTFATFTDVNGTLTINFTSSGTTATGALVDAVLQAITYQNTSNTPPATAQMDWTFSDGNSASAQGTGDNPGTVTGSTTVSITGVNDEPTLTATGGDPTYVEGAGAADLFNTVSASTVESGQTVSGLTLTVTNLSDGASEILAADGTSIALTNGNSGTTATNSLSYSVSVTGGTATVTLSGGTMSEAAVTTLVDGLGYQNTSDDPTTGSSRVVTITSMADSGGTANGGDDTASLAISSTVSLTPVNDAPSVGNVFGDSASEIVAGTGAENVTDLDDATVTNADSADYNGGFLTIAQDSGTANGSWSVDGANVTSGGDGVISAGETIMVGGVSVGTVHATNDGQGGNTLEIDFDTANATSANIQTLIQNLNYSGPSGLGARDFTLTLNDGDGTANGGDQDASGAFTITMTPNPPVISNMDGDSATWTEGGSAVALDTGTAASITDADSSDFDGGNLTVSYQSGQQNEDRITLNTSGTVTLSAGMTAGSTVSVGGTAIGTINVGATGGAGEDLTITFNSDATVARVQTLVQALQYDNVGGDTPTDGDREIRITVTDAGSNAASGSADVTINVDPVNDNPSATGVPTDVTVTEDTASNLNISAISLSDDSGVASVTVTLAVNAGTMTASSGGGVTVTGSGTGSLSLAGTIADIDTWLNTASNVQYTGASNAAGNDAATLTITANDGGNTGSGGGGNVTLGTVNIDITGVNDAPTSSGGTASGTAGKSLTFAASNFAFADVDSGDTLASIRIDTLPATGILKLNGVDVTLNQVITAANIAQLTYTGDAAGSYTFTYSVNDGTTFAAAPATMTVSLVNAGNLAPAAPQLSGQTVAENAAGATIGTLTAVDPEGGAVTFTVSDSRFEVIGSTLKLKAGVSLDFETEPAVNILVTARDALGLTSSRGFNIQVSDAAEQTGSNGNDTLVGTDFDDFIKPGGGNDRIDSGNGRDTINGGTGDDTIHGGDDDDLLLGGVGNDSVRGDAGNDLIYAGRFDLGDDRVLGDEGSDTLGGGRGDDTVMGGAGDDLLWGREGDDNLAGGEGDDLIYNGDGNDTVVGGAGDDTLWANAGDDILSGGDGADTFLFGMLVGHDVISDFDVDEDALDFRQSGSGFTVLDDLIAAASETSVDGVAGVLIDLGGENSVFLAGLDLADLNDVTALF
ncbi:DUF4347 domain-containing protein [Gimibacter soli]|uniref:DUF4347 domain-containing protein n=1 Tax=Gimibacter soli TaxID=3024400 RepID=A0AAF0BKC9_9PROT|nr:DUF4347 domain-containing protein [Gimibacter soli]WCL54134.1 DUF4347 domain-containing protein [Gimibacter soli]